MKKLSELMNTKYGELIFGLIYGLSYFIISLKFIFTYTYNGAGLLALYIAPIIICGSAIIYIKLMRGWKKNEDYKKMNMVALFNSVILLISFVFLADYILFGLK